MMGLEISWRVRIDQIVIVLMTLLAVAVCVAFLVQCVI